MSDVYARPAVRWQPFEYDDTTAFAPRGGDLVWVYDADEDHVSLGYYDGETFRMWAGSDDCRISHWALILRPEPPPIPPAGTNRREAAGRSWYDYRGMLVELDAGTPLTMFDGRTHAVCRPHDPPRQMLTLCGGRACPAPTRQVPATGPVDCSDCLTVALCS